MQGFTTDCQLIPAAAMIVPGTVVPPSADAPVLSILPGHFTISADTALLIASLAAPPLRLAA